MPQLGESVTEGTIGKWLKQPGDKVAKYEPLVEVITDKVNSEIPSTVEGVLLDIRVPEGETVKVGTLIAVIGAPDEKIPAGQPAAPAHPAASTAPTIVKQPTSQPNTQPPGKPENQTNTQTAAPGSKTTRLSPVVARLAAEHRIDVSQIQGTGDGGRVTKQDIEKFIARRDAAGQPTAQPLEQPTLQARHAGMADEEVVPLTPMRKAIAEHMVRSVQTSPHVTTVFEVDMSKVAAHRAAHKEAFSGQGADLTYTAYFTEVVARVLREQPDINSSFGDKGIIQKKAINIGLAVAVEQGLIVPVLKHADELNLLGVARAVNDLARRAREQKLLPDDVQGGTFTITNPGTGGSLFGTPIINQPQAAIMGIGAIVKRPVVLDDAIAIRPMVYLSLSFDHRILDGAGGDRFLSAVKRYLETYA
jgi:2-oxoglutarate dehydrogenase E2 component (dihydrolipoamide succinyltransferase)